MEKKIVMSLIFGIFFLLFVTSNSLALQVDQRITNLSHSISPQDLIKVEELFQKNNINLSNFWVYNFKINNVSDNPDAGYYTVKTYQIYKGLIVFSGGNNYQFNREGNLVYQVGKKPIESDISIVPNISKEDAAKRAVDKENPEFEDARFDPNNLVAELGLFDKKFGGSSGEPEGVLVWKIINKENDRHWSIVDANNGDILLYEPGVVSGEKTCSKEGEMCGGIAGLACCSGFECDYGGDEGMPDASGICINPNNVPSTESNNLIYWVVGGVIVIILVIVLFFWLRRK